MYKGEREMSVPRHQEARPGLLEAGHDAQEQGPRPQAIPAPRESGHGYQEASTRPHETSGRNKGRRIMNSDKNRIKRLEKEMANEFDGEFFRCDYCSVGNSIREEVNEHLVTKKHYSASKYESYFNNYANKKIKLVEKMSIINDDAKNSVLIICPIMQCRLMLSNIFEAREHFMSKHYIPQTSMLTKCYLTMKVILEQECTLEWNSFKDECIVCKQRFSDMREMHQHYSKTSHYLSKLDISPTVLKDQGEVFTCQYCSDSRCFETLIHLIDHQKGHVDKAEGVNKFTLFQTEQKRLIKLSEKGISLSPKAKNMKRKREDFDCGCGAIEHSKKSRTSKMEGGSNEVCDKKDDDEQFESLPRIDHLEENKLAEQFEGEFFRCDYCSINNSSKENISHHLVAEKHHSASMFESVVEEMESGKKMLKLKAKMSVINESAKNRIISLCPDLNCRKTFYSNMFDCTDHIVEKHCQASPKSSSNRYATRVVLFQEDCVIDLRTNKCVKQKKCGIQFGSRKKLLIHYEKTNHFMKILTQNSGLATMMICNSCAASLSNNGYRTFHTNIRSLVVHHEKKHGSDFLLFKVYRCEKKKWLTLTENGISICLTFTQQRNKSKCQSATSYLIETVSNITAQEKNVSNVEVFREIVPNVKVKEEILSNGDVYKDMVSGKKVKVEIASNVKVEEMLPDIRVKKESFSVSEVKYEEMIPNIKIKEETFS